MGVITALVLGLFVGAIIGGEYVWQKYVRGKQ
jgi:hypothetical protein